MIKHNNKSYSKKVSFNLNEQNNLNQTLGLTGEAPPTASKMVPVSSRVLNDRLISVPTTSDRPPSSMYPGLEKLTVCRFCKSKMRSLQLTCISMLTFLIVSVRWKS